MRRGGVVSERISRFEQLCNSNSNTSLNNGKNNSHVRSESGTSIRSGHYEQQPKEYNLKPRYGESQSRISGFEGNTFKMMKGPIDLSTQWKNIISIGIAIGKKYILELTADCECESIEDDIILEMGMKAKQSRHGVDDEVVSLKVNGLGQRHKSQFTMRKMVDLQEESGSMDEVNVTCEVRSSVRDIRLSNIILTCIPLN